MRAGYCVRRVLSRCSPTSPSIPLALSHLWRCQVGPKRRDRNSVHVLYIVDERRASQHRCWAAAGWLVQLLQPVLIPGALLPSTKNTCRGITRAGFRPDDRRRCTSCGPMQPRERRYRPASCSCEVSTHARIRIGLWHALARGTSPAGAPRRARRRRLRDRRVSRALRSAAIIRDGRNTVPH